MCSGEREEEGDSRATPSHITRLLTPSKTLPVTTPGISALRPGVYVQRSEYDTEPALGIKGSLPAPCPAANSEASPCNTELSALTRAQALLSVY